MLFNVLQERMDPVELYEQLGALKFVSLVKFVIHLSYLGRTTLREFP